ncbi:hypothetical protein MBLNU230_g1527t1 [Neophaeotheca triangularis]
MSADHDEMVFSPFDEDTQLGDATDATDDTLTTDPNPNPTSPFDSNFLPTQDSSKQGYGPPPYIAVRLYKDTALMRRKSSAASSRRNSLSSAHSRASSAAHRRTSTGSSQSNAVAQHLRRASIIESRKARLADRAAHAEEVRSRAALAKAAPRGSSSASEERAIAARLAKQKYLDKVAAACAEEVARAKRIAEEVRGRKQEEERKARLEMEERHAEAERRRLEYQRGLGGRRQLRADSSGKQLAVVEEDVFVEDEAVVDEEVDDGEAELVVAGENDGEDRWDVEGDVMAGSELDEEMASRRIQRTFRRHRRRAVLEEYVGMDLNAQKAGRLNFEEMTAFVSEPGVISKATAMLTLLGLQEKNDDKASLNTRTFLSAYMIVGHPVEVLNKTNGAQEQDLVAKAQELTTGFEATLNRLALWNGYTPNPTQLESLSQSYTAYTSAFAAWRLQDSSVMIEGMVASFVELDAIWQTVKDDSRGQVSNDYREGIRDNQVMLLSRIRKLAGPDRADALIKKAIRESRKRKPKRRAPAEVRPRGVESSTSQQATPSTEVEAASLEATTSFTHQPDVRSGELSRLFTPMPSNRIVTHELAIDKDYKLDDAANAELRDQVYRAICDNMRAGFEVGQGAAWTVSAAENVREKLLRMLPPGKPMHNLISETIDLESVNRQCQQGVFSYDNFFSFMANILPKLCAPYRDAEIKQLSDFLLEQSGDLHTMIEKLFRLLRAVDQLSLDYSNFMLMQAAPGLIKESGNYEARLFAADLSTGATTLTRTRRFWAEAASALQTETDRRDPESVRLQVDRPTPQKIYARGLVDIAIAQDPLDLSNLPETLHLDAHRLQTCRNDAKRIVVIGGILLTAKNLLKRDVRSQWKPQAQRLWSLLENDVYTTSTNTPDDPSTPAAKAHALLQTSHNLPPQTSRQLLSAITRYFSQATASRFADPVLKVLFQRLKSHVFARLSARTDAERVRLASGATDVLASCGLVEFVGRVGGVVEVLERVGRVDWEGHGFVYEGLEKERGEPDGV